MADEQIPLDDDSFYANIYSFLGLPLGRDLSDPALDAVLMGVPYDLATSGRPGARSGPNAIRQASAHLRWEVPRWPWDFALGDKLNICDYGDLVFKFGDSEGMLATVEEHAARITGAGKTLFTLGGDHFVTLPLLRGHARTHGELALIHFDAHTDTYEEGAKYDHGSMFRRAPEEGLVDPAHSVQVGIRTYYETSGHPFEVIDAAQLCEQPVADTVQAIRARVGDRPAYLTFDIDCLDPAFAPGTGTPVAGGPDTARMLAILSGIADLNIVGFDLVEVSPPYDNAEISALAGATLMSHFMHMRAK